VTAPSGPRQPTDGPDEWLDGGASPPGGARSWRGRRIATAATALLALAVLPAVPLWPDGDHVDARVSSPTPTPTVAATRPQRPGALSVSARSLDLGRTLTSSSFGVANTGDLPVLYQVSSRTSWIGVEPIGGQLGAQSGRRIDVGVDRDAAPGGRATGTIVVNWDGGSVVVRVHVTQGRGPTPPQSAIGSR
jgi:hypothetical protein